MTTINIETPTTHAENARELFNRIRAVGQSIDGFEFAPLIGARRLASGGVIVPLQFVEAVAVALEASPAFAAAAGGDRVASEMRSELTYLLTHTPAVAELKMLLRSAIYTLAKRRRKLSDRALRAYYLAKGINRSTEGDVLVPHLDAMKAALGRSRSSTTTEEPDETDPTTPTTGNTGNGNGQGGNK